MGGGIGVVRARVLLLCVRILVRVCVRTGRLVCEGALIFI